MPNQIADPDKVFMCRACGKLSLDLYGNRAIDRDWNASCMLHALEIPTSGLSDPVRVLVEAHRAQIGCRGQER